MKLQYTKDLSSSFQKSFYVLKEDSEYEVTFDRTYLIFDGILEYLQNLHHGGQIFDHKPLEKALSYTFQISCVKLRTTVEAFISKFRINIITKGDSLTMSVNEFYLQFYRVACTVSFALSLHNGDSSLVGKPHNYFEISFESDELDLLELESISSKIALSFHKTANKITFLIPYYRMEITLKEDLKSLLISNSSPSYLEKVSSLNFEAPFENIPHLLISSGFKEVRLSSFLNSQYSELFSNFEPIINPISPKKDLITDFLMDKAIMKTIDLSVLAPKGFSFFDHQFDENFFEVVAISFDNYLDHYRISTFLQYLQGMYGELTFSRNETILFESERIKGVLKTLPSTCAFNNRIVTSLRVMIRNDASDPQWMGVSLEN